MKKLLALLIVALLCTAAQAVCINVDFGPSNAPIYTGVGPAPDTGTVWNAASPNASNLKDSLGVTTAVSVACSSGVGTYNGQPHHTYTNLAANLLSDFAYHATQINVTISNLVPNASYDLYFLAVEGTYTGYGAKATFGANTLQCTNNPTNQSSWTAGNNYMAFTGIQADGTGKIIAALTPNYVATDEVGLAGLQIVGIPEPATMSLLGLGVIGLLRRRS